MDIATVVIVTLALAAFADASIDPILNSTFLMPTDFDSFHLSTWSVDYGIVNDEPLMHPQHEWDEEIGGKGTIMVDPIDKMYKAWYISQPGIDYTTYNSSEGATRMISYATSKDGANHAWVHVVINEVGTLTLNGLKYTI
jgi:hypothetical protein